MANYATLKAAIQAVIKQNGNNEITGPLLQQSLLSMITSLGANYQYAGMATPSTNPGTPDQNVFYVASTAGTYTNFNGLVLTDGEIAILKYNGAWSKDSTGAASLEKVNRLGQEVDDLTDDIENSVTVERGYTMADFMNGYTNTNPEFVDIGSIFNFVNSTTPMSESSNAGQLHIEVKKGDRIIAKMKSTSNSYCMAYVFLDTNRTILAWAGKTSQSFDWRANPRTFNIEQDGYFVLQMQSADYNDNVATPLSVVHHTVENLVGIPARVSALEEGAEQIEGRLQDIEQYDEEVKKDIDGIIINSPTKQNGKSITAPDGTVVISGATDIYTEVIPSGVTKIWTKFNSYLNPVVVGYAFYGENDVLLTCGPTLARNDVEKNGVWLGLDVPPGSVKFSNTVANTTAFGLIKFDYEGIKITQGLNAETKELDARVSAIEEELAAQSEYFPKFHLPSRLDFIKGEKVLLFKSAMGNSIEPKNIYCKNSQCRDFPRYVEVEPVTVGESNIEFNVMDENYEKAGTKIVRLNVFEKPNNPANTVHILVVGSSTTSNYANPYEELYRRLVLTTGEEGNPSNPKGLGLSNIVFVGRKVNNTGNFRYEATGGFSWDNYADPQGSNNNYAFTVENPSAFFVGDVYTDGTYDFEVSEISQDDNRVSAKCATQNAPIPASGSLSLKTGTGASTLVYSAVVATITHPFDLGNGVSLEDYMDAYCGGVSPDIIVFQDLVFNSGSILTDAIKTKISTLLGIIHTEYPNAKILISSEALPSSTGGLGTNYKAGSVLGQTNLVAWRLRKLVTDTESFISELNEDLGGDVVMFVPKTVQCDAEYDYPATAKAVNFRVTNKTEEIGTNGMHPTASAGIYNQIDSYYRSIAYAIKKWYN